MTGPAIRHGRPHGTHAATGRPRCHPARLHSSPDPPAAWRRLVAPTPATNRNPNQPMPGIVPANLKEND